MKFEDRTQAGKKLARKLKPYVHSETIIFALPRGGVPVAFEITQMYKLPLIPVVTRKIGAPTNVELGVGAISEMGSSYFEESLINYLGIKFDALQTVIEKEQKELKRRIRVYRPNTSLPQLSGKDVILVDDGVATGVTALAALECLKKLKPHQVIFATPVCAVESTAQLKKYFDDVVCVYQASDMKAIGLFYENFLAVTDTEVLSLLKKSV